MAVDACANRDREPHIRAATGPGRLADRWRGPVASESGKNVLWSRSDADQYYWSLANTALKQSGWGQMVDVQDVSPQAVPPEIVASRLRRNVDLAALALSMHNARLHVFLEPSVITTRKPLSPAEWTIFTMETSAPFTNRRDYYTRCHERIEAVFATEASRERRLHGPSRRLRRVGEGANRFRGRLSLR